MRRRCWLHAHGELRDEAGEADALRAARHLPDPRLEPGECLRRNAPLQRRPAREAEAQEGPLCRTVHCALGRIHPQLQPPSKESSHARHDPLTRSLRPHVDVAVVGMTHEAVTALVQLLQYLYPPYRLRFIGAVEKSRLRLRPVVFQVCAQLLDGHTVDAGRPLVAPDSRQRLPQIAGLDHHFHQWSPPGRRAFSVGGTRHAGFGPSVSGAPGFTLRLRLQGQFQLDVLPLGPHERTGLLTLSVVRAFVGKPTNMPSADFCAAMTALAGTLSPGLPNTAQTS